MGNFLSRFWKFLKEDTWQSWIVSLALAFVVIKYVFFPLMSFIFATPLPLVVIESCSMHHKSGFDQWWEENGEWYENAGIVKDEFADFSFKNGMNKGDIVLVSRRGEHNIGDIIIFNSIYKFPLIHRVVNLEPLATKGDNNANQLDEEVNIPEDSVLGKSLIRIPWIGWVKLIFFEGTKPLGQRGFC